MVVVVVVVVVCVFVYRQQVAAAMYKVVGSTSDRTAVVSHPRRMPT